MHFWPFHKDAIDEIIFVISIILRAMEYLTLILSPFPSASGILYSSMRHYSALTVVNLNGSTIMLFLCFHSVVFPTRKVACGMCLIKY